jgi:hypothetical protein
MFLLRRKRAPQYAYAAGAASADAGQRQVNKLLAPGQHHYVTVTIEGDLNLTVAGTRVYNRGSILAAFDRIGFIENGQDRIVLDPRMLRYYAETRGDSALTATRLASATVVANTHLKEVFRIYFADRRQLLPRESAFIVRDPRADFQFFHQLGGVNNGVARITDATATLQNVKVSVVQRFADLETDRPLFLPVARQISLPVVAANGALELYLRPEWPVRALIIQQDGGVAGEVNDIINKVRLAGDNREIIGPEYTEFDQLVRDLEDEYGGGVMQAGGTNLIVPGAYLLIDFVNEGRLNTILNPAQDTNIRLFFDCQPSVTPGQTVSTINVGMLMLEHDLTRVDAAGRPLVDQVPFAY